VNQYGVRGARISSASSLAALVTSAPSDVDTLRTKPRASFTSRSHDLRACEHREQPPANARNGAAAQHEKHTKPADLASGYDHARQLCEARRAASRFARARSNSFALAAVCDSVRLKQPDQPALKARANERHRERNGFVGSSRNARILGEGSVASAMGFC
jgi:hypothetical protein